MRNDESFYVTASHFIKNLVESKVVDIISPMTLLNVNVPWLSKDEIKGIEVTKAGLRNYSEEIEERIDFRGRPYFWIGGKYQGYENYKNSDCVAIENQKISITPLRLNEYCESAEKCEAKLSQYLKHNRFIV